ncbi:MAG: hypothetical protein A2365_04035 [Candidatus Nealsonbacteria bacterium RIFOXYB1_FULL_40_15]|uniref:GIY-YIG domain-containing protein n=2 Tax=Candidatus Nealsoniibacteriota TaxID=1817911 RepID=A0A1G2ELQ3_9BACT|nr:MAG: hypothetical protein A2427_04480 [Candidatus Nealsonbacteria bacterium RIFOXYC1_FULL_40_7]OGZ27778.1 MAG: hypothetical protein A2365_04035 [Candidatus Nealsonbacteria bacterium RIFOXYB1_FULL_40_15]OGZ28620.1 MAG: hypothetical protein A2562_03735 [Candidatus Nealsonbacteria bacterium RIFOXYD1_FULL_39_11]
MFYTYILQSKIDNSFYIGYTSNLKRRLNEHNKGKSLATKLKKPYKLVFYEAFLNKNDAENREIYLKSGYGRKTIKKLLNKYFGGVA